MRTMCANLEREDALETVLEVPIPQEMFVTKKQQKPWQSVLKSCAIMMKPLNVESVASSIEIQFLLGVIGAPLVPLPIRSDRFVDHHNINGHPIERSMAKYIVKQYIAASGGEHKLNSIDSMYAMGKVKMTTSIGQDLLSHQNNYKATKKLKNTKLAGLGEFGGFVLWRKSPHLWNLELMVSGYKMSAGSDGKVSWRETPWQHPHASRGPPRPLRRALQGLDPMSTANLFANSICMGEKTIKGEDCFALKLEVEPRTLRARSNKNVKIMRHTVWGYFSQKTGLLVQLEDSQLLRIKLPGNDVYWETTMESSIQDYRTTEGVNIAHGGKTCVSLISFDENYENRSITRMEEVWSVEEVDFNIKGLSVDSFLPPSDLRNEDEGCCVADKGNIMKNRTLRYEVLASSSRIRAAKGGAKVVAVDEDNLELFEMDEDQL